MAEKEETPKCRKKTVTWTNDTNSKIYNKFVFQAEILQMNSMDKTAYKSTYKCINYRGRRGRMVVGFTTTYDGYFVYLMVFNATFNNISVIL
jgi:hypothetical protein